MSPPAAVVNGDSRDGMHDVERSIRERGAPFTRAKRRRHGCKSTLDTSGVGAGRGLFPVLDVDVFGIDDITFLRLLRLRVG
ncbi:MAG: hypothetical protein ACE5HU_10205, partial [Acidobacteriota bacterium]